MGQELQDFRAFCDMALDPIQITTPGGRFIYVNSAWQELLGYTAKQLQKLNFSDLLDKEGQRLWENILSGKNLDPAQGLRFELKGRKRLVQVVGTVSRRFDGDRLQSVRAIFRVTGTGEDAGVELDRLFSLSLDLLCVAGMDGYFKKINPAFEHVLGYTQEELLARSFLEFVHPEDQADTLTQVERLAQGLPVVDFQNRYQAKDGTYRWLAWRSAPLPEMRLIYAVARDITEQRRIHELLVQRTEELARSNEDLERFASVASHDLQAPLRAIRNLAQWIAEDIPGQLPEDVTANLVKLHRQVERMENMTDDLLDFARPERARQETVQVDTGRLVREVVHLLSPPKQFQIQVAKGMPVLETHRAALEQVFRNLIGNAVKHHDRTSGKILVSASEQGRFCKFQVRDDGPGISPPFHDQVFKMFRRLEGHAEVEGTGIGLALVKRIVEHHGGEVRLDSKGRGTTFSFTWPKTMTRRNE